MPFTVNTDALVAAAAAQVSVKDSVVAALGNIQNQINAALEAERALDAADTATAQGVVDSVFATITANTEALSAALTTPGPTPTPASKPR